MERITGKEVQSMMEEVNQLASVYEKNNDSAR